MKFRKKPVVIEARQLPSREPVTAGAILAACDIEKWCGGTIDSVGLTIPTLEGVMRADHGDWIIQGVKGEFYPCKPGIFEATYEAVS